MNIALVAFVLKTPPNGLLGALFDFAILLIPVLVTLGTPLRTLPVVGHLILELIFLEVTIFNLPPGILLTFLLTDFELIDFPAIVELIS